MNEVAPETTPPPFDQEKMQLLMAQLQQLEATEGISAWPPAGGWWLLAGLLIVAIYWVAKAVLRAYQIKRLQRQLTAEYQHISKAYQQTHNSSAYLKAVNQLLRRAVIAQLSRADVASLQDDEWIKLLKLTPVICTTAIQHTLCVACYQPKPVINFATIDAYVKNWLTIQHPSFYKHWSKQQPKGVKRHA